MLDFLNSKKQEEYPVPSTQDFDPRIASRRVQAGIPQRPETILPLAAAVVFGFIALAFHPAWATIGGLVCLAASALAWGFNVSYRSKQLVNEYNEKLQERLDRHREQEVEKVKSECRRATFMEGFDAAEQIQTAYVDLQNFLQGKVENNFQLQEFLELGRKCLEQGVRTIRAALGIYIALRDVNREHMQEEIHDWQREISRLKEGGDSTRTEALQKRIDTNQHFLDQCEKREKDMIFLIVECEEIENALKTAQVESAMLSAEGSESFLQSNAAKTLQDRIEAAVRVEERLQGRLNGRDPERDKTEEYLLKLNKEE